MRSSALTLTVKRKAARDFLEIPQLRLDVSSPGAPPWSVPLGLARLLVGTSSECDVRLTDSLASRLHCELRLTSDGVLVRDLGSKNGTLIGGVSVREATLPMGVPLAVGSSTITLASSGEPTLMPLSDAPRFGDALGGSVVMRALFAELERAADSTIPILLLGESSTSSSAGICWA